MAIKASIIIVTCNRRDELERALWSCVGQHGHPEILVMDDGSTDGTDEMVRLTFPSIRFIHDTIPRGCIVQRNRAARLATGDYLFSIDDDAEFSSPTIVGETLDDFDHSPSIGAVAIPYTEGPGHDFEFQRAPDRSCLWIGAQFVGTAYAVNRQRFLDLGGFDESLVHQGEERDFCLRLLQAGYHIRLGNGPPIRHYRSDKRDLQKMAYYGRRNDLLFSWRNIPFPQVIWRLGGTTLLGLIHGCRSRAFGPTLRGISSGYLQIAAGFKRHPVRRAAYRRYRRLLSNGPELLSSGDD